MKCEEALTKIEAYIDHTLSGRELEEFLEHVKSCRECYDELETYYIPKMLQEDLHTRERQVRRRNIFRKTAVFLGVLFFIVLLVLVLSYLGHLELPRLF